MLSVVIPTYNRCENLMKTYDALSGALDEIEWEVVFVDDCSNDLTAEYLRGMTKELPNVKGVLLGDNAGQQMATLAGIRMATYDMVATMDDDLSEDPKYLLELLAKVKGGYPICYGVSVDKQAKRYRKLGTMAKELLFFMMLGKPWGVRLTSFRLMDVEIVDWVKKDNSPDCYVSARVLKKTKRVGNIEVTQLSDGGTTHYTLKKLMVLMTKTLLNYSWLRMFYVPFIKKEQYVIKEVVK